MSFIFAIEANDVLLLTWIDNISFFKFIFYVFQEIN